MSSFRYLVVLPLFIAPIAGCRQGTDAAGMVLLNGTIITVDSADRIAQAVAIKEGRITAVGTSAQIRALVGPKTQVVDLKGLTATPGLIDTHLHFTVGGVRKLLNIELSYPAVRRIADVRDSVRARAERAAPGAWIQGSGWDEGKLEERRLLTARDLDDVSGGHPVWLWNTSGHYGVANSEALRLAKIDRNTPSPPAGVIDRYPDRTATGVLKESAINLVTDITPPASQTELEKAIKIFAAELLSEGMTAVKDPSVRLPDWEAYRSLRARDELGVRVFALWVFRGKTLDSARALIANIGKFTRPYESTGDDRLISGGVKLFMDGSALARTAWVYDNWNNEGREIDSGNRGFPDTDPDVFRQEVRLFHDAGLHMSVHAVGDRAIDWVVDSYAEALAANPVVGRRHGIIHAIFPTAHAIEVMADLQRRYDAGVPEAQPPFMWWLGDALAANLGATRLPRVKPFRTYLTHGIRWGSGSDYFVAPFAARYGMWSSVARETLLGTYGKTPFGTDESIGVHDALKSYTIWAARQLFLERKVGSIEVGKYADIAVWDRNPYDVPTRDLKDMRCELTVFNGRIAFRRDGSLLDVPGGTRR